MKITIEVCYPGEKPKKYSYEDEHWDQSVEDMCEIFTGLLRQQGFDFKGQLEIVEEDV